MVFTEIATNHFSRGSHHDRNISEKKKRREGEVNTTALWSNGREGDDRSNSMGGRVETTREERKYTDDEDEQVKQEAEVVRF